MRLKKLTGIILDIHPYKEFDRILSVFSHEQGRIAIIAKGVRHIKSRRGPHLDLLNLVRMELEENTKSLPSKLYLREAACLNFFACAKKDPMTFAAACLISSFLLRIIPEAGLPQKKLFTVTEKTLEALNAPSPDVRQILLSYFLKATRLLGYLPALLPAAHLRMKLWETLTTLDPQFTLHARRTLGMLAKSESTFSS